MNVCNEFTWLSLCVFSNQYWQRTSKSFLTALLKLNTYNVQEKNHTKKKVWKRHVIVQQLHLVSRSIKCHNAECQNIQCRFKCYKQNPQLPPKFLIIRNKDMLLQVMLVSPVLEPCALLQGPLFQHQKNLSSSPLGSSERRQLGYRKAGGTQASLPSFVKVKKKAALSSEKQIYFICENGKAIVAKTWYVCRIYRSSKNLLLQPFHNGKKKQTPKPQQNSLKGNFSLLSWQWAIWF